MNTPEHSKGARLNASGQADESAMQQIRQQLNDAKARGRWTVTRLAQRANLGRTTVSNALNGGPLSAETLACLAGPLRLDAELLLALLRQANRSSAEPQSVKTLSRDEQGAKPSGGTPDSLGRPVTKLNPWDLEVHRAIDVTDSRQAAWPELPEYVVRQHDSRLADAVEQAVAGQSQFLMLVGPSSTGKTRACWEAIQSLPHSWHVWHPIDPDRPEAALRDLAHVGPHTVVWLNESQHYLLSSYGESIAAKLRSLLSDTSRAPVLVLGTIWPEYHEELTREPTPEQFDAHSQSRHLLAGRDLIVPAKFDRVTVSQLLQEADPRLVAAATHAEDGMITQYLAGAPELLTKFRRATPGARALLEAAMDARRLGHPVSLPLPFLAEAAEGYLTDSEWDLLPENWLEKAFAFLTDPVKGARGALTPVRRPRGSATSPRISVPSYRLADYLEQLGRTTRHEAIPAEFWMAAARHCDGEKAEKLALSAGQHGLMEVAFILAIKAGTSRSLISSANTLANAGRLDEALPCYLRAIEIGETYLIPFVAQRLKIAGRHKEAKELLRKSNMPQLMDSLTSKANRMASQGRLDRALALYQEAADSGNRFALRIAANRLTSAGRLDEALGWYDQCGDPDSLHIAAYRLGQEGRWEEALSWYQRAAEAGNKKALLSAAQQLTTAGHLTEALTWFERAAATNRIAALRRGAHALADAGHTKQALHWYRRAYEAGDIPALGFAANYLARKGQAEEAQAWYAEATLAGDPYATSKTKAYLLEQNLSLSEYPWALLSEGRALSSAGRLDECIEFYEHAADLGLTHALIEVAQVLAANDRIDDALSWYKRAADSGAEMALRDAGLLLAAADRLKDGLTWLERAYRAGDRSALRAAANELASVGDLDEALSWYERATIAGDHEALCDASAALAHAGRLDEAQKLIERAMINGHSHVIERTAEQFLKRGRVEQAITWYRRTAMAGTSYATSIAVQELLRAGFKAEARKLHSYGWDLHGLISDAWIANAQLGEKYGVEASRFECLSSLGKLDTVGK